MIVKPTVTELLTKAQNRFELVIMTAKRSRQMVRGAAIYTLAVNRASGVWGPFCSPI